MNLGFRDSCEFFGSWSKPGRVRPRRILVVEIEGLLRGGGSCTYDLGFRV